MSPCTELPAVSDLNVVSLLETLVSLNTENPPGRELEAAKFLAGALESFGCEVTLDEFEPGRANVIATYVNGAGPTFAFNSHIDVVPAGADWQYDPFVPRIADDKLYARGACDAKGPIAAMVIAVAELIMAPGTWSGTLMAIFVADEEVGSAGAKHFAAITEQAIDYVVVGEPTSNQPVIAHKGSLRPIVRIHGKSAHSGTPDLGINALYEAAKLVGLVERTHRQVKCHHHHLVGNASLTITRLNGGHADNVVPDRCDLMLDRRMVPGESEAQVRSEIQAMLDLAASEFGLHAEIVEWKATTGGASETEQSHPVVAATVEAARRVAANGEVDIGGFQGGCDLVHFRKLGANGVVIGPGSLAVAHQPEEFVPLAELESAVGLYRDIVLGLLKRAPV